jgi:hypothetical protein
MSALRHFAKLFSRGSRQKVRSALTDPLRSPVDFAHKVGVERDALFRSKAGNLDRDDQHRIREILGKIRVAPQGIDIPKTGYRSAVLDHAFEMEIQRVPPARETGFEALPAADAAWKIRKGNSKGRGFSMDQRDNRNQVPFSSPYPARLPEDRSQRADRDLSNARIDRDTPNPVLPEVSMIALALDLHETVSEEAINHLPRRHRSALDIHSARDNASATTRQARLGACARGTP